MFYGQCPYMLENEHPSVNRYVHVAIFGSTVRLVTMVLCRRKLLERQSVSHDNGNSNVWKDDVQSVHVLLIMISEACKEHQSVVHSWSS